MQEGEFFMQKRHWVWGFLAALPVGVVALVGTLFTDSSGEWYRGLQKPPLHPPGYVFAIAWSAIYLLWALALYLSVTRGMHYPKGLIAALAINGVLNAAWPIVFFALEGIGLGVLALLGIVVSLLYILKGFWSRHRAAGVLLLPYLFWGLFALYLNVGVFTLNG